MAAGDMLESSIAFWKEFNSGDLQVSTAAHLFLCDLRDIAIELSLTCAGFCCAVDELCCRVRGRFGRCYWSLCIGRKINALQRWRAVVLFSWTPKFHCFVVFVMCITYVVWWSFFGKRLMFQRSF